MVKTFLDTWKNNLSEFAVLEAIKDSNKVITYEELEEKSNTIAESLMELGIKASDNVIINMPRISEAIIVMMGVLKAGACYVPVGSTYPIERIKFIEKDCNAKKIIDSNVYQKLIAGNTKRDLPSVSENMNAFIIYTSGSTGRPKGIIHTHKNLNSSINRGESVIDIRKFDSYASCAPLYFVAHVFDVWTILSRGGTLHLLSDDIRTDIRRIEDYYKDNNINYGFISPQMLRLYNNKDQSLKALITGSERVCDVYANNEYDIINAYACSEAACLISTFKIDANYSNTPIGKPLKGVKFKIMKDDNLEAKVGEEGEMWLSGDFATGYINLEEKSKEVFTRDEAGVLWYHSGDIGKLNEDGNLIYVNRKDWMVKINGQRVETGEIEQLIKENDKVTNAVVKAFTNEYNQNWLCAFYTGDKNLESDEIKSQLLLKLPEYMIPLTFVHLDSFPINQNGKLDRISLEAPDFNSFKANYVAPTTEKEKKLCEAFEKVLNITNIGIKDDFFAIGGESIKVVMLQKYCSGLSSKAVFMGKTPENIAKLWEDTFYTHTKINKNDKLPLSESQMGVYLECMQDKDTTMYNIPMAYKIPKEYNIDVKKLNDALNKVIEFYPILNVKIQSEDGNPCMVMDDFHDFQLEIEETSSNNYIEKTKDFVKPFDIEKGPLFRFKLLELPNEYVLLSDFNHLIFDGTSVAVFNKALNNAYNDEALDLEEITAFDMALIDKQNKESAENAEALDYFEKAICDTEIDSNLVTDKADNNIIESGEISVFLDDEISDEKIKYFTKSNKITENTLFMAGFSVALSKATDQEESLFCSVNNGRHSAQFNNTIGMFVKTVPLYFKYNGSTNTKDYLNYVQDNFFNAISHDVCGFEDISNKLGVRSDIMFVYQNDMLNGMKLNDKTIECEAIENDVQCNLSLMVLKKNGGFELKIQYRKDLYYKESILNFATIYEKIIKELMTKERLNEIDILTEKTLAELETFNGKTSEINEEETIIDMLNESFVNYKDKVALVNKNEKLTYGELDIVSGKLARHLKKLGIGVKNHIAIMIDRSLFMGITLVGALKNGAAYQPIDPTYPKERINYMIKDSDADILICDKKLRDLADEYNGKVIFTEDIYSLEDNEDVILDKASRDDNYILLYTSGSTGKPK